MHDEIDDERLRIGRIRLQAIQVRRQITQLRSLLLLQDEIAARMAETNRRLLTLSILTACLMPATLVTGFFGMNTRDMPFQTSDSGTWVAMIFVIAAGAGTYWFLKKRGAL